MFNMTCEFDDEMAAGEVNQYHDVLFHSYIRGEMSLEEYNERVEELHEN